MLKNRAQYKDSRGNLHYPDLSALHSLGADLEYRIIAAYNRFCARYNSPSEGKKLRQLLRQLGLFAKQHEVLLTSPELVYSSVFAFRHHWYTSSSFGLQLTSRNDLWYLFIAFLRFCMEERVIPFSALPPGNVDLLKRETLDQVTAEDIAFFESLVPIDLWRSDDAYLDELHLQLRNANDAFLSAAKKEIADTRSLLSEGMRLLSTTSAQELNNKIQLGLSLGHPCKELIPSGTGRRWVNLFSPRHPDFKANVLTYLTDKHGGMYDGRMRRGRSHADPYLSLLQDGFASDQLAGYLGVLTTRRAVPFFVYLLIRNPNITVEALLSCDISGARGIRTLLAKAGEDGTYAYLPVKKMRSHATKTAVLDAELEEVVTLLERLTQPLRDYLTRTGSPHANKLWLAVSKGGTLPKWLSHDALYVRFGRDTHRVDDSTLSDYSRNMTKTSFLYAHTELKPYWNTATLKLLRVTQGLITWFESGGDAQAVAAALGNTTKVTLDHYIPKTIQLIMNKRNIRQFQNLLLSAATIGKPYMLEITDFQTQEQLHAFLSQMLDTSAQTDNPTIALLRSAIEDTLSAKRNQNRRRNSSDADSAIYVAISELHLAVLFLYQEWIEGRPTISARGNRKHAANRTRELFFCGLSRALRQVLPHDPAYRPFHAVYSAALATAESLRTSLRFV